jgi:hypothetical protein
MEYVVSIFLVVFVVLCLGFSGNGARAATTRYAKAVQISLQPAPLLTEGLTREEISERLQKLKESNDPSELKMGAMCYAPRPLPERVEYVCPLCGQKTLYAASGGDDVARIEYTIASLPQCRGLAKQVKGLTIQLDEKEFCRKCAPKSSTPHLWLVVKYPGEKKDYRARDVTVDDLRLINEFLEGKDRHKTSNDGESAMKSHLSRLRTLLGIDVR